MLETNEGEREDEPMLNAVNQGGTSIRKLFALRASQLKASGSHNLDNKSGHARVDCRTIFCATNVRGELESDCKKKRNSWGQVLQELITQLV